MKSIVNVRTVATVGAAVALVLTGCSSDISSDAATDTTEETQEETTTEDPIEEEVAEEDPVEEETEAPSFVELGFGETLQVTGEDGSSSNVTVERPKAAKCQYDSIGCDEPEIGDRVVRIPFLIENTGDTTAEWSESYFVLEFEDGTQVEAGDGASRDYTPDNALGYDAKVRVGGKLKTVMVFEAPEGPFNILILDNIFDGEPFAAWTTAATSTDADSSASPASALTDADACALIDDTGWALFWENSVDSSEPVDFAEASAVFANAAPTAESAYFQQKLSEYSDATAEIGETLVDRAADSGTSTDLFFPTRIWDEVMSDETYDLCAAAGYEWREE